MFIGDELVFNVGSVSSVASCSAVVALRSLGENGEDIPASPDEPEGECISASGGDAATGLRNCGNSLCT